eukprot:CAMPEP_0194081332 /NCGR_PEP_ID=MMETSP0149-20130528/7143_1 /TAXON_ID=122233 /ORGANISM="Chaetoceros debilis, Strain MM31A-1" /LENGTH=524 /DNA_ID=CAMNT_0038763229 /DNA_START=98 /DNA_END=1668 /DNA_ORIENTATION=-
MDISKLEKSATQLEQAANELRGVVKLISKSTDRDTPLLSLDETARTICLSDVSDVYYYEDACESWSDTSSTPSQADTDTSIDVDDADASTVDSVTDESLLSYENQNHNNPTSTMNNDDDDGVQIESKSRNVTRNTGTGMHTSTCSYHHHDHELQYAVEVDSGIIYDTIKIVDSIDLLEYHNQLDLELETLCKDDDDDDAEEGLTDNEVKDTIIIMLEEDKDTNSLSRNPNPNPNDNLVRCHTDTTNSLNMNMDTEQQKRGKDWNHDKDEKEGLDLVKLFISPEKHKGDGDGVVSCYDPNNKQNHLSTYRIDIDGIASDTDPDTDTEEKTEDYVIEITTTTDNIDTIDTIEEQQQKTFHDACHASAAGERSEDDAVGSPNPKSSSKKNMNDIEISIHEHEHGNNKPKPFRRNDHRKKVHFCPQIGLHKIEYTPPTAEEKIYLFYTKRDLRHFKIDYYRELYGYKEEDEHDGEAAPKGRDPILDDLDVNFKDMHGSMRIFWSSYALVTGACSCHTFTKLCCGSGHT